jgi:soluble lytic murein transglycosylase-like protein
MARNKQPSASRPAGRPVPNPPETAKARNFLKARKPSKRPKPPFGLVLVAGTVIFGAVAGVGGAAILSGSATPREAALPASHALEVPVRVSALPAGQQNFEGLRELDALLPKYRAALQGSGESWDALARQFESLARSAKGSGAVWARLVQADCLDRAGKDAAAAVVLAAVGQESQQFAGYCAYRQGGRTALEAAASNQFLGGMGPDVLVAAGEADTDPARKGRYWRQAIESGPDNPAAERACYLLATNPGADRGPYALRYMRKYPEGRFRTEVARSLDPALYAESDRVELAGELMDTGDYGAAIRLLKNSSSGLALYRQGRSYAKLGESRKALPLLAEAQKKSPDLRIRVHLTRAEMALSRRAFDETIAHARIVSRESGSLGLSGLKTMVLAYLRADRDGEAAWIDREIITRYPDSDEATEGRWRAFWKNYRDGRIDAARTWAQGLISQNGLLGAAGGFWLGRIEQDAGRTSAAIAAYNEVARRSPYTYYGWRSRFRAGALSGKASDPGFAIQDGPVTPPDYDLRGLLPDPERSFLGASSRDALLSEAEAWPADIRVLAYLGLLLPDRLPKGRARVLVSHSVGSHYQGILWAKDDPYLSNPLGYWPALESASRTNGLDPLYFAALVKQESYFDPRSRSWVGAMGLAQLMPFTADWVSRQIPGPRKPLTDPAYNMKLGAWYLSYTGKVFDGQPILATSAYNAGVGAAKRWRAWYGSDLEAFIERIPFRETRHYVKKVYGYYWTYRWLYRDRGLGAAYGLENPAVATNPQGLPVLDH